MNRAPRELLERFGSPLYAYDESVLRTRLREIANLVAHRPFHPSISVKANGNPHLLAIAREAPGPPPLWTLTGDARLLATLEPTPEATRLPPPPAWS